MSFLENLYVKTKDAATIVGEKTGHLVNVGKLELKITGLKYDLRSKFEELGKIIYRAEKLEKKDTEAVENAISEIEVVHNKIDELRKQLAKVKKQLICKSCSAENSKEATFCSKCGEDLSSQTQQEPTIIKEEIIETEEDFEDTEE